MSEPVQEVSPLGEMELIRGDVKVEWSNLGEGNEGDYDESDPEDENLLRFDVSRMEDDEWEAVDNASGLFHNYYRCVQTRQWPGYPKSFKL